MKSLFLKRQVIAVILSIITLNLWPQTFTDSGIALTGVYLSSVAWGDYDNDGYLDILLAGNEGNDINHNPLTRIYHNNGDNNFIEQTGISLVPINEGTAAWGDYDNDGDLDILIAGQDENGNRITNLYNNNLILRTGTIKPNIKPVAPTGLISIITPGNVKLSWSSVRNDETPVKAMTYNLRYKIKDSIQWQLAPHASDSGFRRLPGIGNVQFNNSYTLFNLPSGTYYWQIQAVDQGYAGGAWSAVDSFEVKDVQAFYSADEVCLGYATSFTDQSVATDGIAFWKWDFKDGTTSTVQNPSHTYSGSGTYNVSLVITDINGVKDSLEQNVVIRSKPLTGFSAPDVCQGIPVTATNTTNNNGLTINTWEWDFGDGETSSDQQPPPHPYLKAGDYTIKLNAIASNGCADSTTSIVLVGAYPIAAVTANAPLTFCRGDSVTLSVPYDSTYIYDWMVGGVSLTGGDANRYIAKLTGNYSIKIVNPKGNCTTTSSDVNITAKEPPAAPYISAVGTTTFCQGDSVELSVTNTLNYTYQWKKDGGAVGADSNIFIAKSSGNYNLAVTNQGGCSVNSSNEVNVIVNQSPSAGNISLSGPASFCQGGSVTLSVPSTAGYTYRWRNEFGEIPGAETNSYTATESGTYHLEVSNTSGCTARTGTAVVNVNASPVMPVLVPSNYTSGRCPGVNPVRLSADQTITGYQYLWYKDGLPRLKDTLSYLDLYEKGLYKLEADLKGCKAESDIFTIDFPEAPAKPLLYVRGPVVWYMASSNNKASYYSWYRNNELIAGANSNIYVANKTLGTYKVAIGNESECYTFSDEVTIPVTKSQMTFFNIPARYLIKDEDNPLRNILVYPSPTTGLFTIEIDNDILGAVSIDIITEQGKRIRNIRLEKATVFYKTAIDLGSQPKGVYFINLRLDKYTAARKIIIE